jgi:hypothetical protein
MSLKGCRRTAGKNSMLEDLYTDSGGFDAERAADVLEPLLTI